MNKLIIKKILIPLDFSKTSLKALDYGKMFAKRTGAEIVLAHITETIHATTDPLFVAYNRTQELQTELTTISYDALSALAEKLKQSGIKNVSFRSTSGRTHTEIVKLSKKEKADLIIMGTHGVTGFREFVIGSNTNRVIRDSAVPVLSVQRRSSATAFKNILMPFTDRPHSREKVIYAIHLAEIFGSKLHVLGLNTEQSKEKQTKITLQANQIKEIVGRHNIECTVKVIKAPYDGSRIISYAQKNSADLIMMVGDSLKQDITEYFKGSVAEQVINHSEIPVFSIHAAYNPKALELWQGL
jgi:nucleotide-binding universal stress UspA family protein